MINNVTLLGRLTASPELKTTQSGISVISFCIAVERRYTQKDGDKQTDFINCVAWRQTAEFITKYFNKGDLIAVTGEIQTRKYQDKDGINRTATEVVIGNVSFCGSRKQTIENQNVTPSNFSNADTSDFEEIIDSDLPF